MGKGNNMFEVILHLVKKLPEEEESFIKAKKIN